MPKIIERWVLFKYVDGQPVLLSKPFKKKQDAEEERQKFPERERKGIGLGFVRTGG